MKIRSGFQSTHHLHLHSRRDGLYAFKFCPELLKKKKSSFQQRNTRASISKRCSQILEWTPNIQSNAVCIIEAMPPCQHQNLRSRALTIGHAITCYLLNRHCLDEIRALHCIGTWIPLYLDLTYPRC